MSETDRELRTIYTNDTGVAIEVDCEEDVSEATGLYILTRKEEDNSTLLKNTATVSPGETEKIRFSVDLTDYTEEGVYEAKPYVEFSSSNKQQGKAVRFIVKESWPLVAS